MKQLVKELNETKTKYSNKESYTHLLKAFAVLIPLLLIAFYLDGSKYQIPLAKAYAMGLVLMYGFTHFTLSMYKNLYKLVEALIILIQKYKKYKQEVLND